MMRHKIEENELYFQYDYKLDNKFDFNLDFVPVF